MTIGKKRASRQVRLALAAPISGIGMALVTSALFLFLRLTNPNVDTLTFPLGLLFALLVAALFGLLASYSAWFVSWLFVSRIRNPAIGLAASVVADTVLIFGLIMWVTNPSSTNMVNAVIIALTTSFFSALLATYCVSRSRLS